MSNSFYIRFSDSQQKINPAKGIPISLFSELLSNLEQVIFEKDSTTFVKEVKNDSYGVLFYSTSIERHNKIKSLHQKLERNELEDVLPYAKTIKKILQLSEDVVLVTYPENDNKVGVKIKSIDLNTEEKFDYSIITSVTGYITEIGSKSMTDRPHIRIDGYDNVIYLSPEDEKALKIHQKEKRLLCKIKKQYATNGTFKSELLKYDVLPDLPNIIESLSKLSDDDLDFVKDFNPISF